VLAVLLVAVALATAAPGAPPAQAASAAPDRYDPALWRARQDDYLTWATSGSLSPGSVDSILAHAERAHRDPSFTWDANAPDPSDFSAQFAKLAAYKDTGDFDINNYLFLLQGYRADLRPDLVAALEQRVQSFKYWWTEPTPPGIIDSQYYWTENHEIIFLANEFIAGQSYPGVTFGNDGHTGAEHRDHARPLIMKWLATRARFGFSEWLSNVYYMEDVKGLLLLADWSDDPEITRWASGVLDLLLVELASHTESGAFGSTHGRSYQKDKLSALTEDTFTSAKLLFDDTTYPYQGVDNASLLATAHRYSPPAVARAIARDASVGVTRQHQGLPLDPTAPITADPVPPYGIPYDDVMTWWAMGGQFPWQVVPASVNMLETYHLWDTDNFQQAAALRPIVEASTIPQLQQLGFALAPQLNAGLSSAVDTYTWRSPEAMLSTAQEWRPGQRSEQAHIWQATLDPRAQVFVNHPRDPVPLLATYDGDGGYWTGEGATPRAAQHQNVTMEIYAPQYESATSGPLSSFGYEPETHAYFPTERFDQVVEQNGWVIGRKGDGYVALWSWRPTTWRTYDPATEQTFGLTQRFDLQALGGPDNVWISEVGRAADWAGSADPFAAFVAAITSAPVSASPIGGAGHLPKDGFDVQYTSPTRGAMTYGWASPLTVGGAAVDLHDNPRWASPYAQVPRDTVHYCVAADGATLDLDFTALVQGTTFAVSGAPCPWAPPPVPDPAPLPAVEPTTAPTAATPVGAAPSFTG
jgi:hypothetical protein